MPPGVRRKTTAPAAGMGFFSETLIPWTRRLRNFQQLDFENQGGVGRNRAAGAARAVAELRRNGELAPAADLHAGHALVPALDHVALAEREHERVAAVLARVEFRAARALVEEPAGVVHRDFLAGGGGVAAPQRELVDDEAARCLVAHVCPHEGRTDILLSRRRTPPLPASRCATGRRRSSRACAG